MIAASLARLLLDLPLPLHAWTLVYCSTSTRHSSLLPHLVGGKLHPACHTCWLAHGAHMTHCYQVKACMAQPAAKQVVEASRGCQASMLLLVGGAPRQAGRGRKQGSAGGAQQCLRLAAKPSCITRIITRVIAPGGQRRLWEAARMSLRGRKALSVVRRRYAPREAASQRTACSCGLCCAAGLWRPGLRRLAPLGAHGFKCLTPVARSPLLRQAAACDGGVSVG